MKVVRGYAALGAAVVGLLLGCSAEEDRSQRTAPTKPESEGVSASVIERAKDPRPSVLLVVLDTTRADAVSAYGAVAGTTPTFDALALEGTRFARAFAPSPWTVSSHATLFSGLRVDEHGVGLDGVFATPDSLELLAETLREEGYQTAAFAENALLSSDLGFDQGFEHFEVTDMLDVLRAERDGEFSMAFFGLSRKVRAWFRSRDPSRPYFVFVNIMDAHDPYVVRPTNRWVPADVDKSELDFVIRRHSISTALCRKAPPRRDQELLRGLYLGDVSAADQKLRDVLSALNHADSTEKRITVVTADHGEHLGEHKLSGHRFSVRTPALHVPLLVHGEPSLEVGVVESAVEMRSVKSSLLCWALGSECSAALGVPSPENDATPRILGIYSDRSTEVPTPVRERLGVAPDQEIVEHSRDACEESDRVFGDLVTLIRYPHKINWFDGSEPTLHDLSWDPWERSDLRSNQPEIAAAMTQELSAFVEQRIKNREVLPGTELSPEAMNALKSLGYVE
jgi:arylsulfatase A-like enzyme